MIKKKLTIILIFFYMAIQVVFCIQSTIQSTTENTTDIQFVKTNRKVVILPFYNHSKIAEYKYLESTIADSLYAKLDISNNFDLIRLPDDENLHKKYNETEAQVFAKDLSADVVVNGYFSIKGDKIFIFMNAIDIDANRCAIALTKSGEIGIEIYSFVEELSKIMANKMIKALPPKKSLVKHVTVIKEKKIIKEIITKDEYPQKRYDKLQRKLNTGLGLILFTLTVEAITYISGEFILFFTGMDLSQDWVYYSALITKAVGIYGYIASMLVSPYVSAMYYYNFFSYYSVHPKEHAKKYKFIRNGLIAGAVIDTVLFSGAFILTFAALGLYSRNYNIDTLKEFYFSRITPGNPILFQFSSTTSLGLLPLTLMLAVIDVYIFIAMGINYAIYKRRSKKFISVLNKGVILPIVGVSSDSNLSLGASIRF